MSDLEFVKQKCATYEQFIEKKFSASGRGLHEKVSSVEHLLSAGIVKKLRLIATIRNKMFHEADYEFHDDKKVFMEVFGEVEKEFKISPKLKISPLPGAKRVTLSKNQRFKLKVYAQVCILIIIVFIGDIVCSHTWDWGLGNKINNKHQEVLSLEDQIKYEKSKLEGVEEKYSKIRFWQKKSREDIIEIEKAKTRIKILNTKKSEAKDELSKLKGLTDNRIFKPIEQSPLFVPWVIILAAYTFYIMAFMLFIVRNKLNS